MLFVCGRAEILVIVHYPGTFIGSAFEIMNLKQIKLMLHFILKFVVVFNRS